MAQQHDAKIALAMEAIRGAVANLRVALQLIGEVTHPMPPQVEEESGVGMPAMFRARLKDGAEERPLPANEAESPQEGAET